MNDVFYYIKNGDNITGPFPAEQLRAMIDNNIMPSSIMISENRIYWNTAAKILYPQNEPLTETQIKIEPENVPEVSTPPEPARSVQLQEPTETLQKTPPTEHFETVRDTTIIIPDPICATFSMLWNAPQYLKNMHASMKYDHTFPQEERSNAGKFSTLTTAGSIGIELLALFFLSASMLSGSVISFLVSTIVIFLVVLLLLILLNMFFSTVAKQKKLFDRFVLLMQLQLISFFAFMTGMPLYAVTHAPFNELPLYLRIITAAFTITISIAGILNMGFGMNYAAKNLFKFKIAGRISSVIITVILWFLAMFAVLKLSQSLNSFFK